MLRALLQWRRRSDDHRWSAILRAPRRRVFFASAAALIGVLIAFATAAAASASPISGSHPLSGSHGTGKPNAASVQADASVHADASQSACPSELLRPGAAKSCLQFKTVPLSRLSKAQVRRIDDALSASRASAKSHSAAGRRRSAASGSQIIVMPQECGLSQGTVLANPNRFL